jgi:hypothetical protein
VSADLIEPEARTGFAASVVLPMKYAEITYGEARAAVANGVPAESWPVTQHRARHARAQTGEAGPPERSRLVLTNWRIRRRLMAVIAIPTLTAAVLAVTAINADANNRQAAGRVQHLAQLNADTVRLSRALEDEMNMSAAYAATRPDNANLTDSLKKAQAATDVAAKAVISDSSGVTTRARYQPGTVQDLNAVRADINDLAKVRAGVTKTQLPAARIVQIYSGTLIADANTFSAAIGAGANDADLQGKVTALGALLRNKNQVAAQRAILYAVLVSPQGMLGAADLATLQEAREQAAADLADFKASTSTDTAEWQYYSNTVSGVQVDLASSDEVVAINSPNGRLRTPPLLKPESWNQDMTVTIGKTRTVADQLVATITNRTSTLRSRATRDLMLTVLVTLLLVLVLLLVLIVVTRSLTRPLRKVRTSKPEAASRRLPGNGPRAQPKPDHR